MVHDKRGARTEQIAAALRDGFSDDELGQLHGRRRRCSSGWRRSSDGGTHRDEAPQAGQAAEAGRATPGSPWPTRPPPSSWPSLDGSVVIIALPGDLPRHQPRPAVGRATSATCCG